MKTDPMTRQAPRPRTPIERSRHGWFYLKDGTCERVKPCPEGTFRINNSDDLFEISGHDRKAIYFRRVTVSAGKTGRGKR